MYETKIARMEAKVAGVKTVWHQAPSGARYGFDDDDDPGPATGHPTGGGYLTPGPAAPSWDDAPDPAALAKATRGGQAALAAGYGGVLPDTTMAPCGACPACQYGRPQECRRPLSKAEARLRAGQALDADRRRTEATVAELGALYVELSAGLD